MLFYNQPVDKNKVLKFDLPSAEFNELKTQLYLVYEEKSRLRDIISVKKITVIDLRDNV